MSPYNYNNALNGTGAFAGTIQIPCTSGATCVGGFKPSAVQAPLAFATRYGLPQIFQGARNMRLTLRFTF